MAIIYEITTIAGNIQKYEVIEVSPSSLPNNESGVSIKTLENDDKSLESLASHAYHAYSLTGLGEAIRKYPPEISAENDSKRITGAEIVKPERLRLIYDMSSSRLLVPILKVCPIEGEQIYIADYEVANAQIPLKKITFSQEFGGDLDMQFASMQVCLNLRNSEVENEAFYGRNLKKSSIIR